MIEFAYPWAFALCFLPFLIYSFVPAYKEQRDALKVPFFRRLVKMSGEQAQKGAVLLKKNILQRVLLIIGWLALLTAVAKPEWVGEPISKKKSAREIMVALDLSGSMSEKDFTDESGQKVDRLSAAKSVLNKFASQREHDRLGLILFADAPYLQAPFTADTKTWISLLNDTQLGYAGHMTAFGDAIGLAISVFERDKSKQRVLILFTDGNDTGSKMPPLKAAEIAAKHDIKIYTIAVGDPSSNGIYEMDLRTLQKVAKLTGGKSFQALDREEMVQAYDQINLFEKQDYESVSYRPRTNVHHWAFAVYFVCQLLIVFILFLVKLQSQLGDDNSFKTIETTEEER